MYILEDKLVPGRALSIKALLIETLRKLMLFRNQQVRYTLILSILWYFLYFDFPVIYSDYIVKTHNSVKENEPPDST